MRMTIGFAAALMALAALTAPVPPAEARVNTCERACRVVFTRGGSNCQKKVKAGIKARQKSCKQDFQQTGFSNVQKCRTEARKWGLVLINANCKGARNNACIACCQAGGTKETCAPKSPSGAFIDLAGPLS
jgi:hypothetical protein